MSLNDFRQNNDDDSNGSGGFGGPGGPSGFPPISMSMPNGPMDDITEMMINYNERFKGANPTLFRDVLINQIISVLIGKLKPNPVLVGLAGTGKTNIVEELARRIANGHTSIPNRLKKSTVWELPISNLVAGAGVVGQLEERLTQIIDYASDPKNDAIIFIDEIHLLTDDKSSTYDKIAQILKPALARGDMRVIGATTLAESRGFDDDPALARRFSRLIVDELDRDQTTAILHAVRTNLVQHYNNEVFVKDDVLDRIATIADQNSRSGQHRPDNALTLMDRAMADTLVSHKAAIAQAIQDGNTVLAQALQSVPVIPVTENRIVNTARKLMTGNATPTDPSIERLRQELGRIRGQHKAVEKIVTTIERESLSIFPRDTPIAWMFAGSSGCGKTEAVKIVSDVLTGQPPIVLNMTEYGSEHEVSRIIGAPPGYVGHDSNSELPFDTLESNPYRVVLLDEFEKAAKGVQRLFLSALDEGYIKTSRGKRVDFSKAIIVATTNAARDTLSKPSLGFGGSTSRNESQDIADKLSQWFDAELLGRFSSVLAFNQLSRDVYRDILVQQYARQLARIIDEYPRTASALPATLSDDVLDDLVETTFVPSQGARPAERAVRSFIENTVLSHQQAKAIATTFDLDPDEDVDETEDGQIFDQPAADEGENEDGTSI